MSVLYTQYQANVAAIRRGIVDPVDQLLQITVTVSIRTSLEDLNNCPE